TERQAGSLLTSEPLFILATCAVAAVGLAGLCRLPKVWTAMVLIGLAILGIKFGIYRDFLDGAGAFMRNPRNFDPLLRIPLRLCGLPILGCKCVICLDFLDGAGAFRRTLHKFDPLVRIPLSLGVVVAVHKLATRQMAAAVLVVLVVLTSTAPAWSARLLPTGAY